MAHPIVTRVLPLVALTAAAAIVLSGLASGSGSPTTASGDNKTTWRFHTVGSQVSVKTFNDFPNVGGKSLAAGPLTRERTEVGSGKTSVQRGSWLKKTTITGHPTPSSATFEGTSISYTKRGSHKVRTHGTITVQPDGSVRVRGGARITKGWGAEKGASGHGTIRGFAPSTTARMTIHSRGKIRY